MKNMKVTLEEEEAKVCYETFQNFFPKKWRLPKEEFFGIYTQKFPRSESHVAAEREKKE